MSFSKISFVFFGALVPRGIQTVPVIVRIVLRVHFCTITFGRLCCSSPLAFDPKLTILPTIYRQEVVYTCCHAVLFCSWATLYFTGDSMDSTWITACPHTQSANPAWTPTLANSTQQAEPIQRTFSVLMWTGSFSYSRQLVSVSVQ